MGPLAAVLLDALAVFLGELAVAGPGVLVDFEVEQRTAIDHAACGSLRPLTLSAQRWPHSVRCQKDAVLDVVVVVGQRACTSHCVSPVSCSCSVPGVRALPSSSAGMLRCR